MRLLPLFLIACSLFAGGGNSLVSTATVRNGGALPNTSTYSAVSTFCLEGQVDGVTFPSSTTAAIYGHGWNTTIYPVQILVDSSSRLRGFGPDNNENATVTLTGWTAWRYQFSRVGSTYTLKAWNEITGETKEATGAVATGGAWDWRNADFHFGSTRAAYDSVAGNIGFVRLTLGSGCDFSQPPQRLKSSGYANGADWELENSLTDSSGNSITPPSYTVGSASYQATQALGPVFSWNVVRSARVGAPAILNSCASFANEDTNVVTVAWSQGGGPSGTLSNETSCSAATFTPGAFGTATLDIEVTDTADASTTASVLIGGYIASSRGVVNVEAESGSAMIAAIIGPLIGSPQNPWAWKENRDYYEADLWVTRLQTLFPAFWDVAPESGTVAVVNAGNTMTFTGANPQTLFCAGGTSPVDATGVIVVRYASPQIPGQTGHAFYEVTGCPSSSTLTFASTSGWWQTSTQSGLGFTVGSVDDWAQFVYNPIPANYYDNVLAFYSLYYATGIESYGNAARTLAEIFFTGPNWDLGYNYAQVGGNYHPTAGPARGQAVTGLILWQAEASPELDVWAGIHGLWEWWRFATDYLISRGGVGDIRELGYITAGLALGARWDPDAAERALNTTYLNKAVDDLWVEYETTEPGDGGTWVQSIVNGAFGDQMFSGGGISVSVQDGSPTVTLTGATWSSGTFDNCYGVSASKNCWVWFLFNPAIDYLPGNSTAALGELVAYKVASVESGTSLTLTANHNSGACASPCTYGMFKGTNPGLGTLPYMVGMAMGGLGTYVYDFYRAAGDSTRAATVKAMVHDGVGYMATTGYEDATHRLWYSTGFIQCSAASTINEPCPGDVSLNGEAMRGFSADFKLSKDLAIREKGDDLYHYQWGKPGYAAPFTPVSYLEGLNDDGYMNSEGAIFNKWLGFFFGYGFGQSWPAARLLPAIQGNPQISGNPRIQ